jgi:hypothetical protein
MAGLEETFRWFPAADFRRDSGVFEIVDVVNAILGQLMMVRRLEAIRSGWVSGVGFEELSFLGWAVGVDLVAVAVYDDMVVVPAEGGEVVWLV